MERDGWFGGNINARRMTRLESATDPTERLIAVVIFILHHSRISVVHFPRQLIAWNTELPSWLENSTQASLEASQRTYYLVLPTIYAVPNWAMLHNSEIRCMHSFFEQHCYAELHPNLRYFLKSYAATNLSNAAPCELRRPKLSHAAPSWDTLHCILLSFTAQCTEPVHTLRTSEQCCFLWASLHPTETLKLCCTLWAPLTELPTFAQFFKMPSCWFVWHLANQVPE